MKIQCITYLQTRLMIYRAVIKSSHGPSVFREKTDLLEKCNCDFIKALAPLWHAYSKLVVYTPPCLLEYLSIVFKTHMEREFLA